MSEPTKEHTGPISDEQLESASEIEGMPDNDYRTLKIAHFLAARDAALKAENEALKKERDDLKIIAEKCLDPEYMKSMTENAIVAGCVKRVKEAELREKETHDKLLSEVQASMIFQAKLSLYTSWQPSDPGTKEAMEWVAKYGHLEYPVGEDRAFLNEAAKRLAPALTAAMVRLEEAEKDLRQERRREK